MNEKQELPEGWIWTKIGEIVETTSGGTPSRKSPQYFQGDIPWIKSGELNNTIILGAEEFISEEGLQNSSAKIFPRGTLLIACMGQQLAKQAFSVLMQQQIRLSVLFYLSIIYLYLNSAFIGCNRSVKTLSNKVSVGLSLILIKE